VPTTGELVSATAARLDDARPFSVTRLEGDGTVEADTDRFEDDNPAADPSPEEGPTGPFLADAWLLEQVEKLCATHGKAFSADLRGDPPTLVDAAVGVLTAFDLVRPVPGGVVARPALARYRGLVVATASPPQSSLFDPEPTP
jgi:hypothetical protein